MTTERSDTSALQTALGAEHAAVWFFGLLAARTSTSTHPELQALLAATYAAHRERRDIWETLLRDDGVDPTPAAASYEEPGPLDDATQIQAAAREVEEAAATTYGYLVATTTAQRRRQAVAALRDAAVRVVNLGGTSTTAPGTDDEIGSD